MVYPVTVSNAPASTRGRLSPEKLVSHFSAVVPAISFVKIMLWRQQVEDDMQDPDWRPKRTHGALASAVSPVRGANAASQLRHRQATPREQALQSSRTERWPPASWQ